MFQEAVDVLKEGPTPGVAKFADTVEKQIKDIVEKAIPQAHEQNQKELNDFFQSVVDAGKLADRAAARIEQKTASMLIGKTQHDSCRATLPELCLESDTCMAELDENKKDLLAAEEAVTILQTDIRTEWCGNDDTMDLSLRTKVRKITKHYLDAELISDDLRESVLKKEGECGDLVKAKTAKFDGCDEDQKTLEKRGCNLRRRIIQSRSEVAQAFNDAANAYTTAKDAAKAQEQIRKKEFITLIQTECLLERIHAAGELPCDDSATATDIDETISKCHTMAVDTSNLDLIYSEVGQMKDLPEVPPAPCDEKFEKLYYSDLAGRGQCGGPTTCNHCEDVDFDAYVGYWEDVTGSEYDEAGNNISGKQKGEYFKGGKLITIGNKSEGGCFIEEQGSSTFHCEGTDLIEIKEGEGLEDAHHHEFVLKNDDTLLIFGSKVWWKLTRVSMD